MSTQGKIKTLFSDKEKTEALFPRTKVSAVSNNDGVGLDAILDAAVYADDTPISSTTAPVNADTLGGRNASEYATNEFVIDKIAEAQLGGGGNIDLSGYVTEEELRNAVEDIDFPVGSVNGKTGAVELTADDVGAAPISIDTARGNVVAVSNSGDLPLHGLKLYGKTTQDGTPTPEAPVELVSVGDSGAINTTACGGNFHNPNTWKDAYERIANLSVSADGYVAFTNSGTSKAYYNLKAYVPKGTYTVNTETSDSIEVYVENDRMTYVNKLVGSKTVTLANVENHVRIMVCVPTNTTNNIRFTINAGTVALPYEPFKGQTLTASTPNGLCGIPVSSGGNYTDENGQQWACDEIDFARGVYIKRISRQIVSNFEAETTQNGTRYIATELKPTPNPDYIECLCSALPFCASVGTGYYTENGIRVAPQFVGGSLVAMWDDAVINNLEVMYIIEPIETDLSAEELSAYAALHTNYPNTTIYNDGGADMDISYFTPDASVPMNIGSGAKGKVLGVDEHGCVAPKSVTDMGAAPASHVNDKNNPHGVTREQINAAPAGYGLGEETAKSLDSTHDLNNIYKTGWYRWSSSVPANAPSFGNSKTYGNMRVDMRSNTSFVQTVYNQVGTWNNVFVRRHCQEGVFGEWEWVNPPMFVGVEYRTTERFGGAEVYTKLIHCGTVPATGRTITAHSLGKRIIRYAGSLSDGTSLPYRDPSSNGTIDLGISKNNIIITSSLASGASPGTADVQLWYTNI